MGGGEHPRELPLQAGALDQVIVRPRLECGHGSGLVPRPGDDHQGQRQFAFPAMADQLKAAAVRKAQVGEDHVEAGVGGSQQFQGTPHCLRDLQPDLRGDPGKLPSCQIRVHLVVLHVEHAQLDRLGHTPSFAPRAAAGW